jgi:hypothetical protein
MESETSLSILNSTNATSSSSKSDKKKTKKQRKEKKPTDNHLKIRAVEDAGSKWELDLERVHGLTDEQACVVVSLMAARPLQNDKFPPSDDPLMIHAKEGWKYMKEAKRLAGLYPECLGDQCFMNGEWVML